MNAHETRQDANLTVSSVGVASVLASHVPIRVENPNWYDGVLEDYLLCFTCRLPWRGDPETGGCEAVLLARRVIALEGELAKWDHWANPPFVPGAAWPVGEE